MINAVQYIVNADDFGLSSSINKAIISAFQDGLISTATVMVNMPGFSEIRELMREYRLEKMLGIHLNITEGGPLTQMIASQSRFCDREGRFANKLPRNTLWLKSEEWISLRQELKAQIEECLKNEIHPTHIDSHHHIHTVWPVGTLVIRLAKDYGIQAVRLSQNIALEADILKKAYKKVFNTRLRLYGLAKSKFFISADSLGSTPYRFSGRVEISVHPFIDSNGVVMASPQSGATLRSVIEKLDVPEKMFSYWECQ